MAHNPEWHREYARLELAASKATAAWRDAKRLIERKRVPMGARVAYDAALAAIKTASRARFDFEMAGARIVNIATLPITEWARAMGPRRF